MLNSLTINNYQSYSPKAPITFEFVPGVNVIVGLSDTGKSAIRRALEVLTYNQHVTDNFKHDLTKPIIIEGLFDNLKDPIVREKGKENKYQIGNQEWKALKKHEVPDEITDALNMDEINIQTQIELPFLISSNPGEVARFFNRIAGIDKIDSSTKYANSKTLENKRKADTSKAEAERIGIEIERYDYVDTLDQAIAELETVEKKRDQTKQKIETLQTLYAKYAMVQKEIKKLNKIPIKEIEKEVTRLFELINTITIHTKQKEELQILWNKYTKVNDEITELKKVPIIKIEQKIKRLLELSKNISIKQAYAGQIEELFKKYTNILSQKESIEKRLISKEKEYEKLKLEIKICPLCGGKLK